MRLLNRGCQSNKPLRHQDRHGSPGKGAQKPSVRHFSRVLRTFGALGQVHFPDPRVWFLATIWDWLVQRSQHGTMEESACSARSKDHFPDLLLLLLHFSGPGLRPGSAETGGMAGRSFKRGLRTAKDRVPEIASRSVACVAFLLAGFCNHPTKGAALFVVFPMADKIQFFDTDKQEPLVFKRDTVVLSCHSLCRLELAQLRYCQGIPYLPWHSQYCLKLFVRTQEHPLLRNSATRGAV